MLKASIATSNNSVEVKVVNAVNKSVQNVFKGKSHDETPTSGLVNQNFPAPLRQKVNQSTIRWAFIRRPDVNS